jgi:hypothetical protein
MFTPEYHAQKVDDMYHRAILSHRLAKASEPMSADDVAGMNAWLETEEFEAACAAVHPVAIDPDTMRRKFETLLGRN